MASQNDKIPEVGSQTEPQSPPNTVQSPINHDPAVVAQAKKLSTMPLEEIDPTFGMPLSSKPPKGNRMGLTVVLVSILMVAVVSSVIVSHNKNVKKVSKTSSTTNVTSPKTIPPAQVSITPIGFVPSTITIAVGQGIVWTNADTAPHEVNSDPYPTDDALSSFNDKTPILNAQTYDYIFNKAGTYTYHDDLNPSTFKGTIIVR